MLKIFASPTKYIQGPGAFSKGLSHIKVLGTQALLLSDDIVYKIAGRQLIIDLESIDVTVDYVSFNQDSTREAIDRICELGRQRHSNVIIGLGGGKMIDTAKAVSHYLNVPVAILPTSASTDAPTSSIAAIYDNEGRLRHYDYYRRNPDLVLVDSEVISKAPPRLLASGMADGLATWVEGRSVIKHQGTNMLGGHATLAAQVIAKECEETLFKFGIQAMADCRAQSVTPALEAVIEANTLLSGIGFESCGLSIAHAIHNGFNAIRGPIHQLTHGEKVAYGILTQLFIEQAPQAVIDAYIDFFQAIGLPTRLKDLSITDNQEAQLMAVGTLATKKGDNIERLNLPLDAHHLAQAMLSVDEYVGRIGDHKRKD